MSFLRPASNRGGKWFGIKPGIHFIFLRALFPLLDTVRSHSHVPPLGCIFTATAAATLVSSSFSSSAAFTQDPSQIDGVFARLLHFVALILWRRHSLKWMNPFPKDIHFAGMDRNAPSDSWWSA